MKKIHKPMYVFALILVSLFVFSNCGIKTNSDLVKLIDASIQNCDYGDDKGYKHSYGWDIKNCKSGEIAKAKEWVVKAPLSDSLPTLAVLMNDANDKKASTAVYLLNYVYWNKGHMGSTFDELAGNPALIDKKVAAEMVKAAKKYGAESWFQYALAPITHITVIMGVENDLFLLADAAKPGSHLRNDVYVNALRYGRARLFSRIKELGKSSDPADVQTAVGGARNFGKDATPEEYENYCAWAQDFINYEKDYIASNAAAGVSLYCKGNYLDKAMDYIDKKIKASGGKKFDGSDRYILTYINCQQDGRGTEEQCKRRDDLLKAFDALK
jgi:hypothetical protein